MQEVREDVTTAPALLDLADWLHRQQVRLVAMEATSDYWKPVLPVFYLLEAGFECWLLDAKHVKNVPGRPKTDKLDAVCLAKVIERGMCPPSLVHPNRSAAPRYHPLPAQPGPRTLPGETAAGEDT